MIDRTISVAQQGKKPSRLDFCAGEVHKAIHSVVHIVEDHARAASVPPRFAATKLVEGDPPMLDRLHIHEGDAHIIEHVVSDMESALGTDREAALADMRYEYIGDLVEETVKNPHVSREQQRSIEIDKVLTHKIWAVPIFLGIMLTVFWLTFSVIGAQLSDWMAVGIDSVTAFVDQALSTMHISPILHSLIIDGVFAGVGSVLSFLPIIVVLFFFLSMLEDSGYMARVAFVMDGFLRKLGLSGKSFVPMLIGVGCSVPAIMATRTLSGERDKRMTILLIPFLSCSAKLPIYAVFTAAFFPDHGGLVMMALYLFGIIVGIIAAFLLKNTVYRGNPVPFVMELPAYRLPGFKSTVLHMWQKAKDFIVKAFTVIFLASIVVWFLQSLTFGLHMTTDQSGSILADLGRALAPIFVPLGFGSWQCVAALVTGLTAKETVVSTLIQLTGASGTVALSAALPSLFTPLQAVSFLVFTLLYMPCVAALAAVRREMGGMGRALGLMAFQTGVAWIAAFAVYSVGRMIGF